MNEGASSPQDDVVEFSFCECKFCRDLLSCCWHCGAKLYDQLCFQAHVLVCSLRTLPREAVVTFLEPAPALFAEACARKGVLSVAQPPASLAQRDLRADGRLPPCPLARYSRTRPREVRSPISVWFKWVQDNEVSTVFWVGLVSRVGICSASLRDWLHVVFTHAPTTNTAALFCHVEANSGVSRQRDFLGKCVARASSFDHPQWQEA